MALESATYVKDLIATNPAFDDPKSQGDDHLRLIKSTITISFPNVGGEMLVTVQPTGLHVWAGFQNFDTCVATAQTQPSSSNSSLLATTAFVQTLFSATPVSLSWRSRMLFLGGNR